MHLRREAGYVPFWKTEVRCADGTCAAIIKAQDYVGLYHYQFYWLCIVP